MTLLFATIKSFLGLGGEHALHTPTLEMQKFLWEDQISKRLAMQVQSGSSHGHPPTVCLIAEASLPFLANRGHL